MNTRWYHDPHATLMHKRFCDALAPLLAEVAPHHELTHLGFNHDPTHQRATIVLHLAPIGSVRVVPDVAELPTGNKLLDNQ
jgi:hypothetical protein